MERPGLQALLADIEAKKTDVVVIYKIDRLTRSLADFARIVEVLEKGGASFVSVTQSFNTKTSMGRLMLHVLLSFAQFEREVGAERVRDKIAASKSKGMWMGGTVPLGYDAVDRKLMVNDEEACTVRTIFHKFLELRSLPALLAWSQDQGLTTKRRTRLGKPTGGTAFSYGAMRHLLSNRLYAGQVCHKGHVYDGQHEAIIDRELFDEVQNILSGRAPDASRGPKLLSQSLLKGILFDSHGRRMGPAHTLRKASATAIMSPTRSWSKAGVQGPFAFRPSSSSATAAASWRITCGGQPPTASTPRLKQGSLPSCSAKATVLSATGCFVTT
jgi:site-specific DNA recombinase